MGKCKNCDCVEWPKNYEDIVKDIENGNADKYRFKEEPIVVADENGTVFVCQTQKSDSEPSVYKGDAKIDQDFIDADFQFANFHSNGKTGWLVLDDKHQEKAFLIQINFENGNIKDMFSSQIDRNEHGMMVNTPNTAPTFYTVTEMPYQGPRAFPSENKQSLHTTVENSTIVTDASLEEVISTQKKELLQKLTK